MEDEVKDILNQFSVGLENQVWIIIAINALAFIINIWMGFLVKKELTKIKSQQDLFMKKGERYYDLQVAAIKEINPKIIELEVSTKDFVYEFIRNVDQENDEVYRSKKWLEVYDDLGKHYMESDLYLNEDLSQLIYEYMEVSKSYFSSYTYMIGSRDIHQYLLNNNPENEIEKNKTYNAFKKAQEKCNLEWTNYENKCSLLKKSMKDQFVAIIKP